MMIMIYLQRQETVDHRESVYQGSTTERPTWYSRTYNEATPRWRLYGTASECVRSADWRSFMEQTECTVTACTLGGA